MDYRRGLDTFYFLWFFLFFLVSHELDDGATLNTDGISIVLNLACEVLW